MADVEIPLSVGSVKSLIRGLKQLRRDMRDGYTTSDISLAMANDIAADIRANVATIDNLDGNYEGALDVMSAVAVRGAIKAHEAYWKGEQIFYLEFGTGRPGAHSLVDSKSAALANYHPNVANVEWVYLDGLTGKETLSFGVPAYAPVYKAAQKARNRIRQGDKTAQATLKKAVLNAVTVR
jgi:hypothetical protein